MITGMHQYSTIKTVYSDEKKSYVSDVNPFRPMIVQVDFEVCGDVSGVYFTKYAESIAETLNLKGWIRVSPRGTVYGQIQGEKDKVDEMVIWLRSKGSPNSKIGGCSFKNWMIIDNCDFRNFSIRY
ncbi:acylphosphatase-2-like protein 2 [Sarcoptes scabiei]|nr:acylphosphatase-2-like protein 2 [Sarcoptes scabiei]